MRISGPPEQALSDAQDFVLAAEARPGSIDLPPEPVRHLSAQLPERVGVGQRIPLLVWISMTSGARASGPLKPFPVPQQGRRIVLAVSAPGFELTTDAEQELLVPLSGDSEPIRFGLRAVSPGLHHVKVDAFASGTFLGASLAGNRNRPWIIYCTVQKACVNFMA